ncbi:SEC-C metal-binding domain-containing protein [Kitasatospora sp. HPMI-4]|uniref:SEC-C domain-containing protein n=1 Tax=Kitasatospora sp. HPMI-4 TaxID=3448443 RepID=UPI003F1C4699
MTNHQYGSTSTSRTPETPYVAFLEGLGREPSLTECQKWAAEHTGDPEEPRALVDAGWLLLRAGRHAEALALFERICEFGGRFGRDGQVGVIDTLYNTGRPDEADERVRALRAELDAQSGDVADLRIFEDMVEVLGEAGRGDWALEWCEAGLARAASFGDNDEVAEYLPRLSLSRSWLREEAGHELDDDDLAAQGEADAALQEFADALREVTGTVGGRRLDVPEDGDAFDGIVLRWTRDDFTAVRERWPESTAGYGDDYDAYAALVQREARAYSEAGAAHVRMVSGRLAAYKDWASRDGRDPAEPFTRRAFGEWSARTCPRLVLLWPPARNGPCWCDSGRKYKKCCGTPANN